VAGLEGKTAIVTGASSGIGAAIAAALAEKGARVAGGARRADQLETEIALELDVTDRESCERFVEQAVEELGGLDILVNNAGIFPIFPVLAMPDEEWDRVLRTNLYGAFYCAREAGRQMAGKGGVIVNVASPHLTSTISMPRPRLASSSFHIASAQARARSSGEGVALTFTCRSLSF